MTTNHAEGYFSQLKRSLDGTHHHVSAKHLNPVPGRVRLPLQHPQMNDTERTVNLFGKVDGKRLSYRPLTGI